MNKVWYITGASKGLGLALVKFLLNNGQRVAATSRNKEQLIANAGLFDNSNFLALRVDLSKEEEIAASIDQAKQYFGSIDVVVNNAGYGIGGSLEELSIREINESVNVNLMATAWVIHYALPHLRQQRSGHIINISSIAGFAGTTGWSMYAASKFAVIGLTEGLAQDVHELGIKVTAIAPGAFRTDFLTSDSLMIAEKKIEEYKAVHANIEKYDGMNGKQIGSPEKAAQLMFDLVKMPEPPVVLFIGSDAYKRAAQKIGTLKDNLEKYKALSLSTDY
ncbi:MAG: short-chain dehydrogenase/reductase [Citrobacter freundii]|nr:MAG: short-chain dehydrogenase/reductase [Citrobacter freundii]